MRNERAWPQQCWKSCANGSNIVALRFGDHGTKEMLGVVGWKVWPASNFAQQHATTSNNMQQGVQTDATRNIQQCWEMLVNNVASRLQVATGIAKCDGFIINCDRYYKVRWLLQIAVVRFLHYHDLCVVFSLSTPHFKLEKLNDPVLLLVFTWPHQNAN